MLHDTTGPGPGRQLVVGHVTVAAGQLDRDDVPSEVRGGLSRYPLPVLRPARRVELSDGREIAAPLAWFRDCVRRHPRSVPAGGSSAGAWASIGIPSTKIFPWRDCWQADAPRDCLYGGHARVEPMMKNAQTVLADVLRLDADERADVAAELLAGLDGPEITRRVVATMDAGRLGRLGRVYRRDSLG